jgi:hypothetical protein
MLFLSDNRAPAMTPISGLAAPRTAGRGGVAPARGALAGRGGEVRA